VDSEKKFPVPSSDPASAEAVARQIHFIEPSGFLMISSIYKLALLAIGICWVVCAPEAGARMQSEIQQRREWQADDLVFSNNYSGARLSDLRRLAENRYLAISRPEFCPINPSPWYSFEIRSSEPREIELSIMIDGTYPDTVPLMPSRPWLSPDGGISWKQLDEAAWTKGEFTSTARLKLPAGTLRVSAFLPYTLDQAMAWCDKIEKHSFVTGSSIGLSAEGRPIRQLTIADTDALRFVVVLGGQHPPEAAGDHGLVGFIEEICADSDLSKRFRKEFQTVVIPMINPDGKHHGNWRGTLGGMDSNRDWRTQTLPEIRAVTGFLRDQVTGDDRKTWVTIDFHATNRDFFYIGPEDQPQDPESFSGRWFAAVEKEEGGFKVQSTVTANSGTSLDWCGRTLECPAYTREFIYAQEPEEIRAKSRDEARALMRILLGDGERMPSANSR